MCEGGAIRATVLLRRCSFDAAFISFHSLARAVPADARDCAAPPPNTAEHALYKAASTAPAWAHAWMSALYVIRFGGTLEPCICRNSANACARKGRGAGVRGTCWCE